MSVSSQHVFFCSYAVFARYAGFSLLTDAHELLLKIANKV